MRFLSSLLVSLRKHQMLHHQSRREGYSLFDLGKENSYARKNHKTTCKVHFLFLRESALWSLYLRVRYWIEEDKPSHDQSEWSLRKTGWYQEEGIDILSLQVLERVRIRSLSLTNRSQKQRYRTLEYHWLYKRGADRWLKRKNRRGICWNHSRQSARYQNRFSWRWFLIPRFSLHLLRIASDKEAFYSNLFSKWLCGKDRHHWHQSQLVPSKSAWPVPDKSWCHKCLLRSVSALNQDKWLLLDDSFFLHR